MVKSKITVRRWKPEDIPGIIECSKKAYSDLFLLKILS